MLLKSAACLNSDQLLLECATEWLNCDKPHRDFYVNWNKFHKLGFCTIPKAELHLFLQWCIFPHWWFTFSFQSKKHNLTTNELKYLFLKDILKLLMKTLSKTWRKWLTICAFPPFLRREANKYYKQIDKSLRGNRRWYLLVTATWRFDFPSSMVSITSSGLHTKRSVQPFGKKRESWKITPHQQGTSEWCTLEECKLKIHQRLMLTFT